MRPSTGWMIGSVVLFAAAGAIAADAPSAVWPMWRGPLANGVAPSATPPLDWSDSQNIRWTIELPGEGSGTPAVWGDRIFVTAAVPTDRLAEQPPAADDTAKTVPPRQIYRFVVLCIDRGTGDIVWQRTARENVPREGRHPTNSYASASPMTDGERLWVSFGSQGLYCYDLDGTLLWDCDLGEMRTRFGWGEGASPAVGGDVMIVPWDRESESFVVGLDARTGQELWRKDRDEPTAWATPLIVEHGGRTQAILNGTNRVRSYDLVTGDLLWECGGQTVNAIPSPVTDGEFVYLMSGYKGAFATAVPLGATGDITGGPLLRWQVTRGTPYVPSPVLVNGRLYFTAGNNGILTCVDAATGAVQFGPQRLPEIESIYASPVAAAGRIYFASRDGVVTVISAGDTFEVLATNRLKDGFDASPVAVERQLLLRGRQRLYCVEQAGQEPFSASE